MSKNSQSSQNNQTRNQINQSHNIPKLLRTQQLQTIQAGSQQAKNIKVQ